MSAVVASQYYSQKEWALGQLSAGACGQRFFEVKLPLAFVSTPELFRQVHDQLHSETISLVVTQHTLQWSASSFVLAEISVSRVTTRNMVSACKCGIFAKDRCKKKTAPKGPRVTNVPNPAQQHMHMPLPANVQAGDDDSDSDQSLLSALAAEIEKYNEFTDDERLDANAEAQAENSNQDGPGEEVLPAKINSLLKAVSGSERYKENLGGPIAESVEAKHVSSSSPKENLEEFQRLEELIDAVHVDHAVKQLKSSSSSSRSQPSSGGTGNSQADSALARVSGRAIAEVLSEVGNVYSGLIDPEEQATESLLNLVSSPGQSFHAPDGQETSSSSGRGLLAKWAQELRKTGEAFHEHEADFFPPYESFGKELAKAISLVQFLDQETSAIDPLKSAGPAKVAGASRDAGEDSEASEAHVRPTLMQFVSWDFPEPPDMIGRRLRIECARFVWKPPSRNLKDDALGSWFRNDCARIVLVACFERFADLPHRTVLFGSQPCNFITSHQSSFNPLTLEATFCTLLLCLCADLCDVGFYRAVT